MTRSAPLLAAVLALGLGPVEKTSWDFENDEPGKAALGFTGLIGRWEAARDGPARVLAQLAASDDDTFNLALADKPGARDLDLRVRLKAVSGENDRGGGLVWRAKDARNYYVARYNPLEDNFRVYKVEAGKRTMLKGAKVPGDGQWHTMRVTMKGTKIACYLDGKLHLEAEDATFPEAGKVGVWTKSDAKSYFDDLTLDE